MLPARQLWGLGSLRLDAARLFAQQCKDFDTAVAHPFGLTFNGQDVVFVSNQDANVVARAALTNCGTSGTLGTGCQSAYLAGLFPSPATFLDGTFVASQTVIPYQRIGGEHPCPPAASLLAIKLCRKTFTTFVDEPESKTSLDTNYHEAVPRD